MIPSFLLAIVLCVRLSQFLQTKLSRINLAKLNPAKIKAHNYGNPLCISYTLEGVTLFSNLKQHAGTVMHTRQLMIHTGRRLFLQVHYECTISEDNFNERKLCALSFPHYTCQTLTCMIGGTKTATNGKLSGSISCNLSNRTRVGTHVTCGCTLLCENQGKFTSKLAINVSMHNFTYTININVSTVIPHCPLIN